MNDLALPDKEFFAFHYTNGAGALVVSVVLASTLESARNLLIDKLPAYPVADGQEMRLGDFEQAFRHIRTTILLASVRFGAFGLALYGEDAEFNRVAQLAQSVQDFASQNQLPLPVHPPRQLEGGNQ